MATFAPITRHPMNAPFPDMNGSSIEFLAGGTWRTGEIVTAEDAGKQFGMRIDWLMKVVPDGPGRATYTMGSWNLTKEQIGGITKTGDANLPFRVKLD